MVGVYIKYLFVFIVLMFYFKIFIHVSTIQKTNDLLPFNHFREVQSVMIEDRAIIK